VAEIWWLAQEFPIWWLDGLPVVFTPAEVDIDNAGQLADALLAAVSDHPTAVVDMSATRFCDCCVLGVLIRARTSAHARGGELRLVIDTPPVRRVFAAAGVAGSFPIYQTLAGALATSGRAGQRASGGSAG
jgi:anti-anti-sigma factor